MKQRDLHGETSEELLELLIRGGVGEVADVKTTALSSRRRLGSIGLGVLDLGGNRGVLDSLGDALHGDGSRALDGSSGGGRLFGDVGRHDEWCVVKLQGRLKRMKLVLL